MSRKDPSRRYQTAGDLRDDLKHVLSGEPVQATPIAKAARAWQWCKRKPVVAGLGAAVVSWLLFLSFAGPIVAAHQAALARQANVAAEKEANARRDAQVARNQAEQESERRRLLYASDMRTAQGDWLAGDVDSVLNLLERRENVSFGMPRKYHQVEGGRDTRRARDAQESLGPGENRVSRSAHVIKL